MERTIHSFGTSAKNKKSILLRIAVVAVMLMTWMVPVMAQVTDYSGIYYIASGGKGEKNNGGSASTQYTYDADSPANNFYLCPTEGWCFYESLNDFTGTDNEKPFLTTYKCRGTSSYDSSKAVWTIEKAPAPNSDYYYIKQTNTGKYLLSNGQIRTTDNPDRIRVHLEAVAESDLDDKALFSLVFDNGNGYWRIKPKDLTDGDYYTSHNGHSNHVWLVVNFGNYNYLVGRSGKTGGPHDTSIGDYTNTAGTVGIYTQNDDNVPFYLEDYITRPTITNNSSNLIEITAVQSGATLIYTTDGTTPSTTNGTAVNDNTISFDHAVGVTTIKAVAVVNGELSNVATCYAPVLFGSSTSHTYLIQSQNNAWNTTDFHFYMIPGDADANNVTKVNTTSLFRPSMEWYFLNAGIEGNIQYYYIVNNFNGKYLCYDGTNNVYMETFSSGNKFKFKIAESPTSGTFNIYPYGQNILINKDSGNANKAAINTVNSATNANSDNARWKFILPDELDKNDPFTVSNPSLQRYSYFKIANVGNNGHYIIPGTPNVTTSNSSIATVVNTMNWYFEVAQAASDDDWLTYFYIRNAVTGDYLYFTKNANNAGACLVMCPRIDTITSGNEDRCLFTWAKTADANANYYIIPKRLKDVSQNQFSALRKHDNNTSILTNVTRSADKFAWTFPASTFHCAQPVISYDDVTNRYVITKTESDSKIYYLYGEGTLDPTHGSDYSEPLSVAELVITGDNTTLRAIAARDGEGGDQSTEATMTIYKVATPQFTLTDDGKVLITCDTEGARIYYEMGSNPSAPTTESTLYENPIEGAAGLYIKAIAVKGGLINSSIATSNVITFTCATPVIRKTTNTTFTITCSFPTSGVSIYYTTDESEPSDSSTPYEGGEVTFNLSDLPFTVKAIAYAENYNNSAVGSQLLMDDLPIDPDDNYYIIASYDDFEKFVMMVNGSFPDANYKITKDIDVSGIGVISVPFSGELKGIAKADGTLPVVSNLSHAIFNTVNGGKVNSVILDNVSISSGTNVGAICNEATGASRIYNCGILATGSTVETDEDGYTNITSCSSTINGTSYVGGLVGLLDGSSRVINCFSYANITGGNKVGGIVGYNNVATTANNLQTMVMNCMFYGDITGGSSKAPIYNGEIITNDGDADGVNSFNYFRMEAAYVQNQQIDNNAYNCALGAETRFLQRFEFFRHLLNSNRELAAWWASTSTTTVTKSEMLKWVMIPDSIGTSTPYPILKTPGKYPSVVNYTPSEIDIDENNEHRNEGRKLGTLSVTIQMGTNTPYDAPSGAGLKPGQNATFNLTITDKDPCHFNFNYSKVQLPYYNDYCTKNYTENRVVTGWKIVAITGGTTGSFITTGDDVTYDANGNITKTPYNFADRKCTNKDRYSTSSRVFNQGAYWDVPDGVTAITIEPYWAKCVYLADEYLDVVYKNGTTSGTGVGQSADAMVTAANVTTVGGGQHYNNGSNYTINGEPQMVYTTIENARTALAASANNTVYDYAIVLVDNYHYNLAGNNGSVADKPYTVMAADLDFDNEPDANLIMRFNGRTKFHALRYDFLNIPGLGMAQKTTGGTGTYNFGIMQPLGWFETTNTSLFRETQFEYDNNSRVAAPYILQGGVMEQWVLGQNQGYKNKTTYFHVGGNVWFKEFHRGTHQDEQYAAKHPPVSVTGGEYEQFHLTGLYRADVAIYDDDAECYITGGKFGIMAGTGMDGIGHPENHTNGNITWIIDHADINEFYAGSFNADRPAQGNLRTIINNSYVDYFYGGPKFGDLNEGRTVITTATDCTFGTFFGAGYGGNSYSREAPFNHNNIINFPHSTSQAGSHDSWNAWVREYYTQAYNATYGGVSTQFNYQFLPMSSNVDNVARLWIEYVKFSLATTRSVKSTLTGCTVKNNFYGGGSLGKVAGPVESVLDGCIVLGNVYGAGYLATPPPVEVDSINGFRIEPYYYENLGAYRKGVKGQTTTYSWEHADQQAVDHDLKILYTTENLGTLGTVEGNVTLTLKGATIVGTEGDSTTGNVYGGGDQSAVNGNTTVKIQGTTHILGNVYGGGNEGPVGGDSEVIIQDE